MTIVAGILIAPLIVKGKGVMQWRALAISSIILFGVFLIQFEKAADTTFLEWVVGVLPVLVACFAYPLGNRKMMAVCGDRLDTFQRIFGMTLASLPFWLVLSAIAGVQAGAPSPGQVVQSLIVAVSSGIIATTLFFLQRTVQHHQGSWLLWKRHSRRRSCSSLSGKRGCFPVRCRAALLFSASV